MATAEVDVLFEETEGELIAWKVTDGSFVRANRVLLVYRDASGETKQLKTAVDGVVTVDTNVKKGQVLKQGMMVARVDACRHAIVVNDMCGDCGKDLREKNGRAGQRIEPSLANVSMVHHVPDLIVSEELARKLGGRDREIILRNRRLVLLVDLDQTLVHTTNHGFNMQNAKEVVHYSLKGTHFYTKLRPYARNFLSRMRELYEMHIISYGERQYAHRIAEILDPNREYFGHRILSRDELLSAMHKTRNMKALFPCGDELIAIIDDRPDVWQYSDALVQVKPFRFFKETGDISGPPRGPDNVPPQAKVVDAYAEADEDETLEYIATVLTKIHTAFYKHYDSGGPQRIQDLKVIIAYMRSQVLRSCSIVLSGIVPLGADIRKTEAYRLCLQFGAEVTENVTKATTHIVAVRWGTSKVHEARKRGGIAIVNPKWLYACVERWEKADDKEFELTRSTMNSPCQLWDSMVVNDMSYLPTLGQAAVRRMTDEVDEALTEGNTDEEENEVEEEKVEDDEEESGTSGKRKREPQDEEQTEGDESSAKRAKEDNDREQQEKVEQVKGEEVEVQEEGEQVKEEKEIQKEAERMTAEEKQVQEEAERMTAEEKEIRKEWENEGEKEEFEISDGSGTGEEESDAENDEMAADIERQLLQ